MGTDIKHGIHYLNRTLGGVCSRGCRVWRRRIMSSRGGYFGRCFPRQNKFGSVGFDSIAVFCRDKRTVVRTCCRGSAVWKRRSVRDCRSSLGPSRCVLRRRFYWCRAGLGAACAMFSTEDYVHFSKKDFGCLRVLISWHVAQWCVKMRKAMMGSRGASENKVRKNKVPRALGGSDIPDDVIDLGDICLS